MELTRSCATEDSGAPTAEETNAREPGCPPRQACGPDRDVRSSGWAATSAAVGSTVTLQLGAAAATYTVASSKVMTTAETASAVAGAPAAS